MSPTQPKPSGSKPPNEGLKFRCWKNISSGLCAVTSTHTDGKEENLTFKTHQNTVLPHTAIHRHAVTVFHALLRSVGVWRYSALNKTFSCTDISTINWACNRIRFLNVAYKRFCFSNNRTSEISSAHWIKLISWRTFYRLWAAMWRHWSHGLSAH